MLALEAPLLKLTLVAAAGALMVTAMPRHHHHHHATHRLVLHADATPQWPNALFLSAWSDGPVAVELDPDHLRTMQFEIEADVTDGCRWRGVETLTPNGNHFDYSYDESILSCHPNPVPTIKTPRGGTVTIE